MALVTLKHGQMPRDIEGFPKDAKRTAPGALYLSPGTYKEITDDELAFAKKLLGDDALHVIEQPAGTAVATAATPEVAVDADTVKDSSATPAAPLVGKRKT